MYYYVYGVYVNLGDHSTAANLKPHMSRSIVSWIVYVL